MKRISNLLQVNTIGTLDAINEEVLINENDINSGFINVLDKLCTDNENIIIPNQYKVDPIDGDILILITLIDDNNGKSRADPCILGMWNIKINLLKDKNTKRPIAGTISFDVSSGGIENFKLDIMIKKMIHEIIHVLSFNINLFEYYPDYNGKSFRFIDTDGIT